MRATTRTVKTIALLTVFVMLFTLIFSTNTLTANAASVNNAVGKVDASNGAILRKATSTGSGNLIVLKNNTELTLIEEVFTKKNKTADTSRWYKVKVSGKTGYIRSDLIKDIKYNKISGKIKSSANYRVGPGTAMKCKGKLKKGASVNVLMKAKLKGAKTSWYLIEYKGSHYYASSKWIKITGTESASKTAAKAKSGTNNNKQTASSGTKVSYDRVGINYPEKITEGSPFNLKGSIDGSHVIQSVKAGVVDEKGNWTIAVNEPVGEKIFSQTDIDSKIKFGTLAPGKYHYCVELKINEKVYKIINVPFEVVKASNAEKITNQALATAWPAGTSKSKYSYSSGNSTAAYAAALDKAYPNREKWGQPPRAGASCDVFVGTMLRSSGVDSKAPRGLSDQMKYFPASDKYTAVNYTGDRSTLRSGDVIVYQRIGSSNAHTCIYLKKNGKEYIAEANYNSTYGILLNRESELNLRLSISNKKKMFVYRIVEK